MWQSSLRSWRNCYARVTFLPRALNLRIRHGGLFIIIFLIQLWEADFWSLGLFQAFRLWWRGKKTWAGKKIRGCGDFRSDLEWERDVTWCDVMWSESEGTLSLSLSSSLIFPRSLKSPHTPLSERPEHSWTLIFCSLMPKAGESVKTCFRRLWKNLNTHISGWNQWPYQELEHSLVCWIHHLRYNTRYFLQSRTLLLIQKWCRFFWSMVLMVSHS